MTTTQTTDIRITAWALGRRAGSWKAAFRYLENGQADAVAVFAALERNEWGVREAIADGIDGLDITVQADPVTQVAFTGPALQGMVPLRRASDWEIAVKAGRS